MITLRGKGVSYDAPAQARGAATIRLVTDPGRPFPLRSREGFLVGSGEVPEGFGWYIVRSTWSERADLPGPLAKLSPQFDYLDDGDVVRLVPETGAIRVLHRRSTPYNSFLLTERCDNFCLMCSQPPRRVQDGWIADEIMEALPLIDRGAQEICFSGGEPTLLGDRFLNLVRGAKSYLPRTALHVLSNGRSFAQESLARKLAEIRHHDVMIGIPVYSDLPHLHDHVVQADGAFDETIRGILNLKRHSVRVEIRVVLHRLTIPRLTKLAEFLVRNLTFVDHVALMGLEMTGFTRANLDELWIDPVEYQAELEEAVGILDRANLRTSIYNSQLCLMDRSIWRFARRSISDWKQECMPECEGCEIKSACGGFFSSAKLRYSRAIKPARQISSIND